MKKFVRKYETVVVTRPDINSNGQQKLMTKFSSILAQFGGKELKTETWGKIRLAYPIKKHTKGNYFYFLYLASKEFVMEFEKSLKLMDGVLRFLTVQLMDKIDLEKYNYEMDRIITTSFVSETTGEAGEEVREEEYEKFEIENEVNN